MSNDFNTFLVFEVIRKFENAQVLIPAKVKREFWKMGGNNHLTDPNTGKCNIVALSSKNMHVIVEFLGDSVYEKDEIAIFHLSGLETRPLDAADFA